MLRSPQLFCSEIFRSPPTIRSLISSYLLMKHSMLLPQKMLDVFVKKFYEERKLAVDFVSLVVLSAASETVTNAIKKFHHEKDIVIKKKQDFLYRYEQHRAWSQKWTSKTDKELCSAIYLNCHCHRLAWCFKHLTGKFPGLLTMNLQLLSLQKTFHYTCQNSFISEEMQVANNIEVCKVVKSGFCMVQPARYVAKEWM